LEKNNNVIFGLILLVISVLAFTHSFVDISFGTFSVLFLGAAFLMLYRTKRKSWALIVGMYLVYFGCGNILQIVGLDLSTTVFTGCSFFIVPGIIFMVLFLNKNKTDLLIPASFLVWFGLYILSSEFTFLDTVNIARSDLFILFMGFAMLTNFLLGGNFVSVLYLYIGSAFIAYCGLKLLASVIFGAGPGGAPAVTGAASLVLIAVSLYMIFRNKRKR
jgi:hypothetical protein